VIRRVAASGYGAVPTAMAPQSYGPMSAGPRSYVEIDGSPTLGGGGVVYQPGGAAPMVRRVPLGATTAGAVDPWAAGDHYEAGGAPAPVPRVVRAGSAPFGTPSTGYPADFTDAGYDLYSTPIPLPRGGMVAGPGQMTSGAGYGALAPGAGPTVDWGHAGPTGYGRWRRGYAPGLRPFTEYNDFSAYAPKPEYGGYDYFGNPNIGAVVPSGPVGGYAAYANCSVGQPNRSYPDGPFAMGYAPYEIPVAPKVGGTYIADAYSPAPAGFGFGTASPGGLRGAAVPLQVTNFAAASAGPGRQSAATSSW